MLPRVFFGAFFSFCLQVREASSELVVAALMALLDVAAEDPAAFAAK